MNGDCAFALVVSWHLGPAPVTCLLHHRFQGDSRLEQSGCYHHCVDENIERRNHYLDLAGIENYTSQFGPGEVPSWGQLGGLGLDRLDQLPGVVTLSLGSVEV